MVTKTLVRISLAAAIFLVAQGAGSQSLHARSTDPSWFPKISCKEAWSKIIPKGEHIYSDARYENYAQYEALVSRINCYKEWNVLVYISADNNLSPYAVWDMFEMEAGFKSGRYGGSTLTSDLVVESDTAETNGIYRRHIFQQEAEYPKNWSKDQFLALSETHDIHSPIVSVTDEGDAITDESKRFRDFIEWGVRKYPAKNTMVILWGHGQGWAPSVNDIQDIRDRKFGGVAFDESSGGFIGIPDIRDTLADVRDRVLEGRPIDIYLSDACLMQMLEVAYEIGDGTRFIVGSAQIQDYLGLPYRRLMYLLNRHEYRDSNIQTDDEAYLLAKKIPEIVQASFNGASSSQGRYATAAAKKLTMSAVSTWQLKNSFMPEFIRFKNLLVDELTEHEESVFAILDLIERTPSFEGGSKEFGSLLTLILQEFPFQSPALYESAKKLRLRLDETVLSFAMGPAYESVNGHVFLPGAKSVSVWMPTTEDDYKSRIELMKESQFYRASKFADLMKLIFN